MTPRVRLYACIAAANNKTTIQRAMGDSRRKPDVLARREVMGRLYADGFPLAQIGRWLHRDHATVMHSLGLLARGNVRKPKATTQPTTWPVYQTRAGNDRPTQPVVTETEREIADRLATLRPSVPCFRCGAREGCNHR